MGCTLIHVIATDFRVFGRLEAYLSNYQFSVIDSSISVKDDGKIHAAFEVCGRAPQTCFDAVPVSEILNSFFALIHQNSIQRDALYSISKLVRDDKATIHCEDGRIFRPLVEEKNHTATKPDCSKPFIIQAIEISDCRIQVTVKGEGQTTIYFSEEDKVIMTRIVTTLIHLNRHVQKVLDGHHQQVFAPGAIRALFQKLLDLADEVNAGDLYLQELTDAGDIPK